MISLQKKKYLKGIIYVCLASLFFAIMSALVKMTTVNLNVIDIIFLRSVISTIILIFFIKKLSSFKTTIYSKHLIRTVLGILSMVLNFYAIQEIPLSNYSIVSFGKIFFIIPLAYLFLKEKLDIESFCYITFGFFGIALILGFEDREKNLLPYYLCAIFASLVIAYIKIFLKSISTIETNLKIQFFFSLTSIFILLVPYIIYRSQIVLKDLFYIFLLSISGLLAQYFTVEGLKQSDAVKIMPFDFSRIIFSIIIGISFFKEQLTVNIIVGSIIIFIAGCKLIQKKPL